MYLLNPIYSGVINIQCRISYQLPHFEQLFCEIHIAVHLLTEVYGLF